MKREIGQVFSTNFHACGTGEFVLCTIMAYFIILMYSIYCMLGFLSFHFMSILK